MYQRKEFGHLNKSTLTTGISPHFDFCFTVFPSCSIYQSLFLEKVITSALYKRGTNGKISVSIVINYFTKCFYDHMVDFVSIQTNYRDSKLKPV